MRICDNLNKKFNNSWYKISDQSKKRRKLIRHLPKRKQHTTFGVEGISYKAGGFENY